MGTKKIKINFLFIALIAIAFGCKKENRTIAPAKADTSIKGEWNLVHIYGGIAGLNDQYAMGEIVWTFNNDSVSVQQNGTNSIGLPTGTYQYEVINANNHTYLSIEQGEWGEFIVTADTMDIDENKKSFGEGACGMNFKFVR